MPFTYSGPRMRLKANVRIPARVVSGPGISQAIANGVLTTGLDLTNLDSAGSIANPSLFRIFIYNDATDEWEYTTLDNVPTTTTGDGRTGHGDSNYVILNTDRYVALTATFTAPRVWSLPAANTVPAGTRMSITDEVGGISSTNTLTIGVTGADTVNGASTFILNAPRAGMVFRSDGTSKWSAAFITTSQLADGILAANAAGLAKMADGYLAASSAGLAKVADGFFTDTTAARAKFADKIWTNAKLADMAANTIKGSIAGGPPVDLTPAQALTLTGALSAPQAGLRNLIINGDFRVNQRAFAGGAIASGAYFYDRWKDVAAGSSVTVSARTATIASGAISQVIEGASIRTGTYVINWVGTAICTVDGVAKTKGATFTLTSGTNCSVVFFPGTVGEVQVEPGAVVTQFEQRPIGLETSLCQRYYCITKAGLQVPAVGSILMEVRWPVEMRAAPTTAVLTAGAVSNATVAQEAGSATTYGATFQVTATVIDGFVSGRIRSHAAEL
jgi:hypothetical protein